MALFSPIINVTTLNPIMEEQKSSEMNSLIIFAFIISVLVVVSLFCGCLYLCRKRLFAVMRVLVHGERGERDEREYEFNK